MLLAIEQQIAAGYMGGEAVRQGEYRAESRALAARNQQGGIHGTKEWQPDNLPPINALFPPPGWTVEDAEDERFEWEERERELAFDALD